MAIDPKLVSIIPASQLPTGDPTGAADFLFYEENELKKGSMSNIYDKVNSGIKGIATETNAPTPWVAGDPDLFEKWEVVTPITSASAWGIEVTQAELDENNVYFYVTNGSISIYSKPIIEGADAYEVAVENGFVGTEAEWLTSLEGADGIGVTDYIAPFENLIDPAQTTQQGFFAGYGITDGGAGYEPYRVALDYYPAVVGDSFWMEGVHTVQFYDSGYNVIYSAYAVGHKVDGIFTVPATTSGVPLTNAAYMRVASDLGATAFTDGKVSMGRGDVFPNTIPPYNIPYAEPLPAFLDGIINGIGNAGSPLKDKEVTILGDSITAYPNSFITQLCAKHGANLIKLAADGAWVSNPSQPWVTYVLSEQYLNISTVNPPDVILIAGGTNDNTSTLGVFSDTTNATFYGALHVLLAGLRGLFLDARIGYIAPIPGTYRFIEGDMTNMQYLKWKAIKEVCAYYSVPVWNGNTEFGAFQGDSDAWRDKYMPDTLHPSDEGHTWYMNRVEDFVLNLAK